MTPEDLREASKKLSDAALVLDQLVTKGRFGAVPYETILWWSRRLAEAADELEAKDEAGS